MNNPDEGATGTFWGTSRCFARLSAQGIGCDGGLCACGVLLQGKSLSGRVGTERGRFRYLSVDGRHRPVLGAEGMIPDDFSVKLINTGLANQFVVHMRTALYAGVFCASPYLLYLLFRFVSPALYTHERRYAVRTVGVGYLMFLSGAALNYFLIFPLTFRFLGTYQVSAEVENTITLESYMDTLLMMTLTMGIVFEIPILCWLLARLGFLTASFMRRYRRHAIVLILVAAAVITPTSDVFTLLLVGMPMWMLYEAGIYLVALTEKRR